MMDDHLLRGEWFDDKSTRNKSLYPWLGNKFSKESLKLHLDNFFFSSSHLVLLIFSSHMVQREEGGKNLESKTENKTVSLLYWMGNGKAEVDSKREVGRGLHLITSRCLGLIINSTSGMLLCSFLDLNGSKRREIFTGILWSR